jgi:hypothetical protein
MNIMDMLKDQLGGQVAKQLGGALGASEEDTGKLLGTSIPAILGSLGKVASTDKGADALSKAMNGMGNSAMGGMGDILGSLVSGKGAAVGGGLLATLFGGKFLDGIAAAISKVTGINASLVKTGLGFIAPMILGGVAKSMKGQPNNAAGVKGYFASQSDNIKQAMPAGFSLDSIPGFQSLGQLAPEPTPQAAAPSGGISKLLIPLVLAGILAAVFFFMRSNKAGKAVEDAATNATNAATSAMESIPTSLGVDQIKGSLDSAFASMNSKLESITDVASAEAAVPALQESMKGLDTLSTGIKALPTEGKSMIAGLVQSQLDKLNPLIEKISAIPGLGDTIKTLLTSLKEKLTAMLG